MTVLMCVCMYVCMYVCMCSLTIFSSSNVTSCRRRSCVDTIDSSYSEGIVSEGLEVSDWMSGSTRWSSDVHVSISSHSILDDVMSNYSISLCHIYFSPCEGNASRHYSICHCTRYSRTTTWSYK